MRPPLLVVAFAAIVLAACGSPSSAGEVVINASDSGFSPTTVEVQAGQPVRLTMANQGSGEHQFAIKEIAPMSGGGASGDTNNMSGMSGTMNNRGDRNMYQVHMAVPAGQRMSVEFAPSKPGQYEFVCVEPGHTERGTLIVR